MSTTLNVIKSYSSHSFRLESLYALCLAIILFLVYFKINSNVVNHTTYVVVITFPMLSTSDVLMTTLVFGTVMGVVYITVIAIAALRFNESFCEILSFAKWAI